MRHVLWWWWLCEVVVVVVVVAVILLSPSFSHLSIFPSLLLSLPFPFPFQSFFLRLFTASLAVLHHWPINLIFFPSFFPLSSSTRYGICLLCSGELSNSRERLMQRRLWASTVNHRSDDKQLFKRRPLSDGLDTGEHLTCVPCRKWHRRFNM